MQLDIATAPHLGTHVLDCLECGHRRLIVDLAGVRLVDSAGIGVLLSLERRVRAAGGELVLTNPSAHVRHVFALTGVERFLRVEA